jgi:Domain of unknown function (DUF4398)
MPRVVAALAACALAAGGLAGCGPIRYVGDVTRRASDAVDAARAAQAEKYAPYWWTRATQYLHKAREVAAHADFQGATRFGRLATEAANRAAADARIAAGDPSKRPVDLTPGLAPGPAPGAASKPTTAPVAPARDLPAAPRGATVPEKGRPIPAKQSETKPPSQIAPAKEPR